MTSLKKQTVSGIKWLVGSSFLQKGISFTATIVLARILGPADFGLFALAFVAIDALGLFKSMGFDSALIQRKDDIEKAANTAFFIIPLLGIVLYLILSISAPFIGKFLNNQQIVPIIRALGLIFVISCIGKVPAALLEKNMRFARVTVIEVSTAIIYSVSAITFALLKFGVWSLVIGYILKTLNQNILTFVFSGWRPKFEFDKKVAIEMFHFGKYLFLGGVVWFLKMNLDNVLVGKLLGITSLGFYAIAFNVANFSSDYFGSKVFRVTYPAYSKIQNRVEDLRAAYLKVFKHISLIALPFGAGIALLGKEFILLFYGDKWLGAVNILIILAWAGVFNTLPSSMGNIFLATGKPKLTFYITLLQVLIFVIFITPMARLFGMNGVGMVVSISSVVAFLIMVMLTTRILKMNMSDLFIAAKPAMLSTMIMVGSILCIKYVISYFQNGMVSSYNFAIAFPFAFLAYGLTYFVIDSTFLKEFKSMIIS